MSLTKKEVLIKLYNEFNYEINKIVNVSSIFPNLDEIDIIDVVFIISNYFGPTTNCKSVVLNLMETNNIILDDETFNRCYEIIERFLILFNKI
jgi:hypothetical protein